MDITLTVFAWLGTTSYLLAYYLVSTDRVSGSGWTYQGMNVFAAVVLTAYGVEKRTWPSVALNGLWFLIGVVAVGRQTRRYQSATAAENRAS